MFRLLFTSNSLEIFEATQFIYFCLKFNSTAESTLIESFTFNYIRVESPLPGYFHAQWAHSSEYAAADTTPKRHARDPELRAATINVTLHRKFERRMHKLGVINLRKKRCL